MNHINFLRELHKSPKRHHWLLILLSWLYVITWNKTVEHSRETFLYFHYNIYNPLTYIFNILMLLFCIGYGICHGVTKFIDETKSVNTSYYFSIKKK